MAHRASGMDIASYQLSRVKRTGLSPASTASQNGKANPPATSYTRYDSTLYPFPKHDGGMDEKLRIDRWVWRPWLCSLHPRHSCPGEPQRCCTTPSHGNSNSLTSAELSNIQKKQTTTLKNFQGSSSGCPDVTRLWTKTGLQATLRADSDRKNPPGMMSLSKLCGRTDASQYYTLPVFYHFWMLSSDPYGAQLLDSHCFDNMEIGIEWQASNSK